MKTFNNADIFTVASCEEAKKYINCIGYFSDSLFTDLNKWQKGCLIKIDEDTTNYPFLTDAGYNLAIAFRLFIPLSKVKEVEKIEKYQPFKTFEEFKACTHKDVGDVIVFKAKNTKSINTALVTGYHGSCLHKLGLGCMGYSFQELFHDYLWLDTNNNWQPFGVLEDESEV